MRRPANQLFYFVFIALLIGCRGNSTLTIVPANLPSDTATPTKTTTTTPTRKTTPSVTPSPTRTETLIPVTTNTPAIPTEARLYLQCLEVVPYRWEGIKSSGILVLDNRKIINDHYEFGTYLLDMVKNQQIQIALPNENQYDHTVSPDRRHLAYNSVLFNAAKELIQDELVIATADGQRLKTISSEEGWGRILGWLNNERLVINIAELDAEENTGQKPATLLALNPFSGERQILKPNFPGIYSFSPLPYWHGWSVRTYDPSLTRVAYLRTNEENQDVLALWDLQKQQLLVSLFPYGVSMPIWAPDGSRLVTNAPVEGWQDEELFLIDRDGHIEQLTNLGAYYEHVLFIEYTWSPDGRYIAAWISTRFFDQDWMKLVIVDTNTRQVTDYCLQIKFTVPQKLIWSPDGEQLVYYEEDKRNHSRVILVDRVHGFAAQIAENEEPMGWMLSP